MDNWVGNYTIGASPGTSPETTMNRVLCSRCGGVDVSQSHRNIVCGWLQPRGGRGAALYSSVAVPSTLSICPAHHTCHLSAMYPSLLSVPHYHYSHRLHKSVPATFIRDCHMQQIPIDSLKSRQYTWPLTTSLVSPIESTSTVLR